MQRRIGHPAYPAQRMILRYPFLRRNVTEHACLLVIVSAHVLLDAATPSPVTASATFSAACLDPFFSSPRTPRSPRPLRQFFLFLSSIRTCTWQRISFCVNIEQFRRHP